MPPVTDRTSTGTEYRAIVDRFDARPNRCTIFQSSSEGGDAWISAPEESYVDLVLTR
jgi:hypothetical protein